MRKRSGERHVSFLGLPCDGPNEARASYFEKTARACSMAAKFCRLEKREQRAIAAFVEELAKKEV